MYEIKDKRQAESGRVIQLEKRCDKLEQQVQELSGDASDGDGSIHVLMVFMNLLPLLGIVIGQGLGTPFGPDDRERVGIIIVVALFFLGLRFAFRRTVLNSGKRLRSWVRQHQLLYHLLDTVVFWSVIALAVFCTGQTVFVSAWPWVDSEELFMIVIAAAAIVAFKGFEIGLSPEVRDNSGMANVPIDTANVPIIVHEMCNELDMRITNLENRVK